MNMWKKAALGTILVAGISGGAAWAQSADRVVPPSAPIHGEMMMHGGKSQARFAGHLTSLHQKLALSTQQESGWQAFSQKMLDHHDKKAKKMEENWDAMAKATLPERLDMMDAVIKANETDRLQMHKDIKVFYETLSPEQKVIMDKSWGRGFMDDGRQGKKDKGSRHEGDRRSKIGK